jgi:hypothetical protein
MLTPSYFHRNIQDNEKLVERQKINKIIDQEKLPEKIQIFILLKLIFRFYFLLYW